MEDSPIKKSVRRKSSRPGVAKPVTRQRSTTEKTARPGKSNLKKTRSVAVEAGHADPWRAYHSISALLMVIGALAGTATLSGLVHYIEHLSPLQESGLVASATIAMAGLRYYLTPVMRWFSRLSR